MKSIIINNGSASKKYALYDGVTALLNVHYEQTPNQFILTEENKEGISESEISKDVFTQSFSDFMNRLMAQKYIMSKTDVASVAIRIVAPGVFFQQHRRIDNEYLLKLDDTMHLSPLHIRPVQQELQIIQTVLPGVPLYAISDSAFHVTTHRSAKLYALPKKIVHELGLYRYGYHGISVGSTVGYIAATYTVPERMIICHLGGGSSITAVKQGQSFDTSMGFSPLEGLPMATRAGSADPNALISIMDAEDFDTKELQHFLYKECGLLGISGFSDTRTILDESAKGNTDAQDALALYVYHIQKTIGAYAVALGGVDMIVFTGTIGERSAEVRKRICEGLQSLGVAIDLGKNKLQIQGNGKIDAAHSRVQLVTFHTQEMQEMARILQTLMS